MIKILFVLALALMVQVAIGQATKKYAACCGAEAVDIVHSDMSIFVPNAFTPDKDGLNDLFFPHLNGNVVEVIDFTIYTDEGDTVLFYRPTVVYKDLANYGWNGLRDGYKEPYYGAIKYSLKMVNKQGETKLVYGRACSLECSTEADDLKVNSNCFFPDQVGVNGKVDKSKKTKEKKCKG